MRSRRTYLSALIGVAGFFVLIALLVLMLRTAGPALSEAGRIVAGTVGFAVLVGWWAVWAFRIHRAKDEYLQQVELAAWYWGGLMGLMASVPVFGFIGLGGLHWLDPGSPVGPEISKAFTLGYMTPMMMQVGGVLVVALWMRLSKR